VALSSNPIRGKFLVVATSRKSWVIVSVVFVSVSRKLTVAVTVSVSAPVRGYGRACRAGVIAALKAGAKIVAFIDGDGSDCPEFMPQIVGPILEGEYDFVIGSRVRGQREPGSMNSQQLLAGFLAGRLIRWLYGAPYTDMSPFRAIRAELLPELDLREET
jgi:hypothetical protein